MNAEKNPVNSKHNEINNNKIKNVFLESCFSNLFLNKSMNIIIINFNNNDVLLPTVVVDDK